ncbi:CoA transferase [Glutamicibacter endophyticus]
MQSTEPVAVPFVASLGMAEAAAALYPDSRTDSFSWEGPRWWWAGALDVEALVLDSYQFLSSMLGPNAAFTSSDAAATFNSLAHLRIDGRTPQSFAPLSGFRRTNDGWVRLHANYPHHERALMRGLRLRDARGLDATLSSLSAQEAETTITQAGGIAAAVRRREEFLATPAGGALAAEPLVNLQWHDTPGPRRASPVGSDPTSLPLAGLRIVDLTRVIAGPCAGRILASLGADVLRIDPPDFPELLDAHIDTSFGKRSVVADLSASDVAQQLHAALDQADAVLLGYRTGSLDRFGLASDELLERYPHLAVLELNAWGHSGPRRSIRGFDSIVQAATGISVAYGTGDDPAAPDFTPGALPVQALDHATGVMVAATAIGILRHRVDGRSARARFSLARTAHELLSLPTPPASATQRQSAVELRDTDSAFGALRYVPPALRWGGRRLNYLTPPPPVGSSAFTWR